MKGEMAILRCPEGDIRFVTVTMHTQQPWKLQWAHGTAEVHAIGGMIGPIEFRLVVCVFVFV